MSLTLPQIYEQAASLPSGGYITVDSRFDKGYMYSMIHLGRAVIAQERWKTQGKIPPIYFQPFTPKYEILSQSPGCFTQFYDVPDIIQLDQRASGIGYIGATGELCQFREISSEGAFAAMQHHRILKMGRGKVYALILGGGEVKVYSPFPIENMRMQILASDPTTVPSYNIDMDSYPIDAGDLPKLYQYLMQGVMSLTYKTPIDRVNDQRDITVPPPVRT